MPKVRILSLLFAAILVVWLGGMSPVHSQPMSASSESNTEPTFSQTVVDHPKPAAATTTDNSSIPVDELKLLVKPLTLEELQNEAAAWFFLLKQKVQAISETEIAIKHRNRKIQAMEEAANAVENAKEAASAAAQPSKSEEYSKIEQAKEQRKQSIQQAQQALQRVKKAAINIQSDYSLRATVEQAEIETQDKKTLQQAKEILDKLEQERDKKEPNQPKYKKITKKMEALRTAIADFETARDKEQTREPDASDYIEVSQNLAITRENLQAAIADAVGFPGIAGATFEQQSISELEAIAQSLDSEPNLEKIRSKLTNAIATESEIKNQLVKDVTELQGERTLHIDRLQTILDEIDKKGGLTTPYQKYIQAIRGTEIDVRDTSGLGVRLMGWWQSEQGGRRWRNNIVIFTGILAIVTPFFQILGWLLQQILQRVGNTPLLLRQFLVVSVKRSGILVGLLLALAVLQVNLGPILALLGGASFILAFALQTNISNFASGFLLILYEPFRIGDEVQLLDIWGEVEAVTLATTRIRGFNGEAFTIPNERVWQNVIQNNTGTRSRRIYISIQVDYYENLAEVERIFRETVKSHPFVFDNPPPYILPTEYTNSTICVGLCAWTDPQNFWQVRRELFEMIQNGLANANIAIAYPTEIRIGYQDGKTYLQPSSPPTDSHTE